MPKRRTPASTEGAATKPYIVDLFCGVGGFSTGAKLSGTPVSLAVDNDTDGLDIHTQNHPTTEHVHMTLGTDEAMTFLVNHLSGKKNIHIHASPPCTFYSTVNWRYRDTKIGDILVDWVLELIQRVNPRSWTIENVPVAAKPILALVEARGMDFVYSDVFKCSMFQVPCMRKRYIIGGGKLSAPVETSKKPCAVASVIKSKTYTHTFVLDMTYKSGCLKRSSKPKSAPCRSFTCTSRPYLLCVKDESDLLCVKTPARQTRTDLKNSSGTAAANALLFKPMFPTIPAMSITRRPMTDTEVGLIMSFPKTYIWKVTTSGKRMAVKGSGNSLPPMFAKAICTGIKSSEA